jgi:hypothetical protein
MNNDAVLDRETSLVWSRQNVRGIDGATEFTLKDAYRRCRMLAIGTRGGWRLPTLPELQTLLDYGVAESPSQPRLPVGHPFALSGEHTFWTSDAAVSPNLTHLIALDLETGQLGGALVSAGTEPELTMGALCVRGAQ